MNLNRPHFQACAFCDRKFKTAANRQVFCSIECRLWSQVKKGKDNECWPWVGATDKDGYGRFRWNYGMFRSHAVAYRLANPDSQAPCALHTCDNPPCCNPLHLFGGTQGDNVTDRHGKGRTRWNPNGGENGRRSKRNPLGQFMCGV